MADDTIHLLKECDSGTKTAVNAIRQVLDNVKSTELLSLLTDSLKAHEAIGDELHSRLSELGEEGKEPSGAARISAWAKINLSLLNDDSDKTVASLMTDGCNMGVKSLNRYLNQYKAADEVSKDITNRLIHLEQQLATDIRIYL